MLYQTRSKEINLFVAKPQRQGNLLWIATRILLFYCVRGIIFFV